LKCTLRLLRRAFLVDGRLFSMTRGERIHTENSLKNDVRDARILLRAGGWTPMACWTDQQEFFLLILAKEGTTAGLAPNHVTMRI
jgi:L-histidine N-alpha-methyltransferase